MLLCSTDMSARSSKSNCECQCLRHLNTYREDLGICVDDVRGKYLYAGRGGDSLAIICLSLCLGLAGLHSMPSNPISVTPAMLLIPF